MTACRAGTRCPQRLDVPWIRFNARHRHLQDWPMVAAQRLKPRRHKRSFHMLEDPKAPAKGPTHGNIFYKSTSKNPQQRLRGLNCEGQKVGARSSSLARVGWKCQCCKPKSEQKARRRCPNQRAELLQREPRKLFQGKSDAPTRLSCYTILTSPP